MCRKGTELHNDSFSDALGLSGGGCHVSNRRTQPEQRDGLRIDAFIYTLTIAIVMHAECGGNGNPG